MQKSHKDKTVNKSNMPKTTKKKEIEARNRKDFGDIYLAFLRQRTKEDWGRRCSSFAKGCACCNAWRIYDKVRIIIEK